MAQDPRIQRLTDDLINWIHIGQLATSPFRQKLRQSGGFKC